MDEQPVGVKNMTKKKKINKKKHNFDDFLVLGRYVLLVCLITELLTLSMISNMAYMTFAGAHPNLVNCSEDDGHSFARMTTKEACNQLKQIRDNKNSCDLQLDGQFHSINIQFNKICEDEQEVKHSITIQMIGVMVGSLLFGQLSDTYGRKKTDLIAVAGVVLCTFASSFANSLTLFTIIRFLVGIFNGGMISVTIVYFIENLPKRHRLWLSMVLSWSPNTIIFAGIAYLAGDWRTLARVTSLLTIPPFFMLLFTYESPRWLAQKGRLDEARETIAKISRFDGRKEKLDMAELESIVEAERDKEQENVKKRRYTFHHLFYSWNLLRYTFVFAFSYFAVSIANYSILFSLEKFGSLYLNLALTGAFRYALNLMVALMDYVVPCVGRKLTHGVTLILMATSMITAFVITYNGWDQPMLMRICILMVMTLASQIYVINGVSSAELYPTPIRNIANSFLQLSSRVGVALAPQLFRLSNLWSPLPYLIMAILTSTDLILFSVLLPETKGHPLIDSMPEKHERIFANNGNTKKINNNEDKRERIFANNGNNNGNNNGKAKKINNNDDDIS